MSRVIDNRPTVNLDFETFSESDLKKVGAWVYAEHESTEVLTLSYHVSDRPGMIQRWKPGMALPLFVTDPDSYQFRAWNSFFEYCVWHHCLGWPVNKIDNWYDTMADAAAMSLPLALGKCGAALHLPQDKQKDKRGRYLIQRLCKPNRGKRIEDPALLQELCEYCDQDVVTEMAIAAELNRLSAEERRIWLLDQRMNIKGVTVDIASARAAIKIIAKETVRLNNEVVTLTGGALHNMGSRKQVMDYFEREGYPLDSYTKGYIRDRLQAADLPADLARLLEIRLQTGKTSTAKYEALINITAKDGRAHGLLQYHAASTGRWGGRLFQPHNLPRPSFHDTDTAIDLFGHCDNELLTIFYGDAMECLSSCLRGMLTAAPGQRFAVSDYSAIEARVLAWIAGQTDVLDVFRGHGKIYEHTASGIYNKPWQAIGKESIERFIGKVATLALGYQGGVKAFTSMAETYGVEIPEDEAQEIVTNWRQANGKIKRFWYCIEAAAIEAVENKDSEARKTAEYRGIKFQVVGRHLYCKLPSGRNLCFPFVHFTKGRFKDQQLTYWGVDSVTKKWVPIQTYGGKLTENIVQAISRDLIAEALLNVSDRGFTPLISVHDEIIAEISTPLADLDVFNEEMCRLPSWAEGLPLRAEGFTAQRYRK